MENKRTNPLTETQHKIIRAVLSEIVLSEMLKQQIIKPTNIIKIVKKKYNMKLSPGTLYPIFYALERTGHIRRLNHRRIGTFALTDYGKKEILYIKNRKDEFLVLFQDVF